jgi:hypothetical protein
MLFTYHIESKCDYNLLYQLTLWSRVLLEKLIVAQLVKKFPAFMAPEGSLPCPQDPAIEPCSQPVIFSPDFLHPISQISILI